MPKADVQYDLFDPQVSTTPKPQRKGRAKPLRASPRTTEALGVRVSPASEATAVPAHPQDEAAPSLAAADVVRPLATDARGSVAPGVRTLADVLALYDASVSEHPARIRICSALRAVGRGLQLPLENLPADLTRLAPLLAKANPALAGIGPPQLAGCAVHHGQGTAGRRFSGGPAAGWNVAHARVERLGGEAADATAPNRSDEVHALLQSPRRGASLGHRQHLR